MTDLITIIAVLGVIVPLLLLFCCKSGMYKRAETRKWEDIPPAWHYDSH